MVNALRSTSAPVEGEAVAPDELDEQVGQMLTAASEPAAAPSGDTAAPADVVGDDLANQIQSLLDDVKAQEEANAAAPAPPVAHVVRVQKPATEAERAAALKDLDNLLAAAADDAVAGEFETVNEVLATYQQAQASKAAKPSPAEPTPSEPAAPVTGDAEAPPATSEVATTPEPEHEAATVEQVIASASSSDGATAADVARELDTQPEQQVQTQADPPAPAAAEPDPQPSPDPTPTARPRKAFDGLRVLFAVLSLPIRNASPGVRGAIGYFALVQFFVAAVLLGVKAATAFLS